MHDIRLLREDPARLVDGLKKRGVFETYEGALAEAAQLELERRTKIGVIERKKSERNERTQKVALLKRNKSDATAEIAESKELGDAIAVAEESLAGVEARLEAILIGIPNIPLAAVPAGGESANTVVRSWGDPRPAAGVVPHWEIGERLGILDLAAGAKLSGSGFIVLRGAGARLTRALMAFMLDMHTKEHGYEEMWVPFLVNRASMTGTGQLPKFEDDAYARVRGRALPHSDGRSAGDEPLSRRNARRGRAADGAHRVHSVLPPRGRRRGEGHARPACASISSTRSSSCASRRRRRRPRSSSCSPRHAEAVLQRLGLPYRRLLLAAGDTGFASAKTYDLEVWAPGVGKWLEVSSCCNFTDFQARRANIRYRPAAGEKPRFVHTLNGSALAFPRTIVAMLEHYQRADGTITVPEVLRPYLGADRIG